MFYFKNSIQMKKSIMINISIFTEGINDNHHQRGPMQNNNSRIGPIQSYPDPMSQVHFSGNNTIGSPKGGNSGRMFQGPNKGMPSGLPSGHNLPPQPSSNNVLHQINNNHISSQQLTNPPWSNGSAGSSGISKIGVNYIYFYEINFMQ